MDTPTPVPAPLRCRLGFHRWAPWSPTRPVPVRLVSHRDPTLASPGGVIHEQHRACVDCRLEVSRER